MNFECKLIDEKTVRHVLSIRKTVNQNELASVLSDCYSQIKNYLNSIGEVIAGPPFVGFLNNDMEKLEIDVGYPVRKKIEGKGNIIASDMPAGKKVSCVNVGSYEKIEPSYLEIKEWLKENNYRPEGISYQFFLDDPLEIPDGELQTEIVYPRSK